MTKSTCQELRSIFYKNIIFVTSQEEVVTITMNKYRKGQQMLEEAEHRADMAEKSVAVRGRGRSMSVTREITKVVRV